MLGGSLFALAKLRGNKVLSGYIYFSFKMKITFLCIMFYFNKQNNIS